MHPSAYYIKCLICEGLSNAEIQEELAYKRISPIRDAELARIRRELDPRLDAEAILESNSHDTLSWLRDKNIYSYFRERKQLHRAEALLSVPRVREILESMLLTPMTNMEALKHVRDVAGFEATSVRDIKLYRHYFWNSDLLMRSEMVKHLADNKKEMYLEALNGGRAAVLSRMGMGLSQTDDELHREAYRHVAARLQVLQYAPFTEETDKRAIQLCTVLTRMWKNIRVIGDAGLSDAQERLTRYVEERATPQIPAMGQGGLLLSGDVYDVEADELDP